MDSSGTTHAPITAKPTPEHNVHHRISFHYSKWSLEVSYVLSYQKTPNFMNSSTIESTNRRNRGKMDILSSLCWLDRDTLIKRKWVAKLVL